jgi:AcrR family transcriptional regulator
MSLRERKKQQVRNRIIAAAKDIFIERGYLNAKISEIAAEADLGVGTIYNYYRSKGELLIAVFAAEMAETAPPAVLAHRRPASVADEIAQLFEAAAKPLHIYPKSFLREIFAVVAGNIEESQSIRSSLVQLDQSFMVQVESLLAAGKKEGRLRSDLNLEQAVPAIYSIVAVPFIAYCYTEATTPDRLLGQVRLQLQFLLADQLIL